jgi:hypothetical protein
VASVRRCIDCDLLLVDEVDPDVVTDEAPSTGEPVGEGDQIGYELEGWGNQLKITLEGMLDRAGVRRVWEGGALVVAARDEETVDALIATVEGSDVPELDDDAEQVAFEIEGLDADGHAELDSRLIAEGIAHAWSEDGDLLVALEDDEQVAAIIDEVIEGDGDDDGLESMAALSDLYVAVDRLVKSPLDAKLAAQVTGADRRLQGAPLPYGLTTDEWLGLQAETASLVRLLDAPTDDDEEDDDGDADDVEVRDELEDDEPEDDDGSDDDEVAHGDAEAGDGDGDDAEAGVDDVEDRDDDDGDDDEGDGEAYEVQPAEDPDEGDVYDEDDLNEDGVISRSERISAAARDLRTRLLDYV